MKAIPTCDVEEAVSALRRGDAIGLPTETVYGLAADATNPAAVARVFALKRRPANHPLIVHIASAAQLGRWARVVSPWATALAASFWPGPLTLVLPRAEHVLDAITGGQETVAVRVPAHPLAQKVLIAFGSGVVAPSANRFGRISPTMPEHVRAEFGDDVACVLDGGACVVGIESTILDVSTNTPRILRPGAVTVPMLEAVLDTPVASTAEAGSPRVPGGLPAHYAPRTPLELVDASAFRLLDTGPDALWLTWSADPPAGSGLRLPAEATGYAKGLYAALRILDARGARQLYVEKPPESQQWAGVRDRLTRAAAGAGADERGS